MVPKWVPWWGFAWTTKNNVSKKCFKYFEANLMDCNQPKEGWVRSVREKSLIRNLWQKMLKIIILKFFLFSWKKTFNKYQVRKHCFFQWRKNLSAKFRYCYCKHMKNLIIIIMCKIQRQEVEVVALRDNYKCPRWGPKVRSTNTTNYPNTHPATQDSSLTLLTTKWKIEKKPKNFVYLSYPDTH